jgi:N-acetylglucosamine-6-sulfatase
VTRAGGGRSYRPAHRVLLFLAILLAGATEAVAAPNVVVVLTDDQRARTLRYMPKTSEELVAKGVNFARAMVPTSLCCPSRVSILTGRYAHDTGIYSNLERSGGGWPGFQANGQEADTIATALDGAGYRTALVGKYLNDFDFAPAGYVPPGWDTFMTWFGRDGAYYDYTLTNGDYHGLTEADFSTDVFTRHAVDFIQTTAPEEPLFLYYAPFGPHTPYTPAPRHDGMFDSLAPWRELPANEDVSTKPAWVRAKAPVSTSWITSSRRGELEHLQSIDDGVGAIVAALRDADRLGDTLIVYLSDNGFMLGQHRLRWKMTPYAAATRIPLVVRWDGHAKAGTVDYRIALNVDVARTVEMATGVPINDRGLDLLGSAVRTGFVMEASPADEAGAQTGRPAYCGWRNAKWLYVRYATGEEELYAYHLDPHELKNLARVPRYAFQKSRMGANAVRACSPTPPGYRW